MTIRSERCRHRRPRRGIATVLGGLLVLSAAAADEPVSFNRDVRPILSDRCYPCHGPDANHRKAGLRLDERESAVAERDGVRAIVPGAINESELVKRVTAEDPADRMPPPETGKALDAAQIEVLKQWIAEGAPYERHWSFLPPSRPPLPEVTDAEWARGAIDLFILRKLEANELLPSPPADAVTLARRLSFDLTGLPPDPHAVEELALDTDTDTADGRVSDEAYTRLVDRLLASPHFGERLAIFWLDLVRYADTVGYHGDQEHNAAPYRNWVIRALNENLPFDEFTTAQLAGDLVAHPTLDQRIASAYNRLLQTTHEGGAQDREYLAKYAADRVRNVSTVWMGATMGCAECHDHKFDPYTQKDFYSLAAFFADLAEQGAYNSPNSTPTTRPPEIDVLDPISRLELGRLEERQAQLEEKLASGQVKEAERFEKELAAIRGRREELEKRKRRVMVSASRKPRLMRVLNRGDWMDESGEIVSPAVPEFLGDRPLRTDDERATRLDLARWLTSPEHPQTARVFVNRLWYLFFGVGLSRVTEDLGAQGEWPTHPELLDWLAVEFVESGWDIKHVVRLMVLSNTYRQGSVPQAEHREKDPENRLFARQARFRLTAEMVRDNALAVSGLLVHRLGGDTARPYQPAGYYAHLNFPRRRYTADLDAGQYRRGVYMHWQRQFLHPMLRAFDAPSREECTTRRPRSNTPLAALTLLNDPTFVEASRALAGRALQEGGATDRLKLRWMWREVLSRWPTERELDVVGGLLARDRKRYGDSPEAARALLEVGLTPPRKDVPPAELAAWTNVCRAMLNLHETITRS